MKKLLLTAMFLGLLIAVPAMADVDVHVNIPLPPPIPFPAPPQVIVIPETNVYAAPDVDADLYFWNGKWWRYWQGRWYRSPYYNRGWVYYRGIPPFYFNVDPHWRRYYREHNWYGHRWEYKPIPYNNVEKNWKKWEENRHWEKKGTTWGVNNYERRPEHQRNEERQKWEHEYHQRPEVQKHRQWEEQQENQKEHKGREGAEEKPKPRRAD